ncbi:Transcriptional regulator/sugar kinase [Rubrobacter radiotolerans]|uniref:ROK family protein n=1 Tax=Rubrobacter radiotolerans TaxID=42256 RepID=A0A023X212_RUBRA|nr:ROK family protein [Rubrobacter radiotolerans]AHY46064.1 Transcriptional regulator/sugar kinase [Rubrobacter radiotolerans]MDX5893474.1 ROK family protein [Rubrobacter radiotolerans]SMC03800.1 glucokinase [Rubrobacter radiotolerans DSM 5868]
MTTEAGKTIGVDVGGTKIAAGVVDASGRVLSKVRYPSAGPPETLLANVLRAVREARRGHEDVLGLCLSVPGTVVTERSAVAFSPNLPTIEGIPLKERLEGEIGLPMTVENDANAAAWGEFRFGVGRSARHLVFVTLGTGIGAGIIVDGRLLRGAQGAGGELGHTTVQAEGGPRCACGNAGCFEALASGTAIGRFGGEAAAERPESALGRLAARRRIRGEDVTELAGTGDPVARSVLARAGRWLGVGLANAINTFNPEVVAVGGGAAASGEMLLAPAREEIARRAISPARDLARVMAATLGPDSGLIGAAALAIDPASGEPFLGGTEPVAPSCVSMASNIST